MKLTRRGVERRSINFEGEKLNLYDSLFIYLLPPRKGGRIFIIDINNKLFFFMLGESKVGESVR